MITDKSGAFEETQEMTQSPEKRPRNSQVVILCGGKGTRMGAAVNTVKKELVEIGDRPMLWHVMKIFAAHGFEDFILPLGYRGQDIRRYFLDYNLTHSAISFTLGERQPVFHQRTPESNWRVTLVDTGLDANKGARVKRVEKHITTELFLLTYGDGVADINVRSLLEFHKKHGKLATVTGVRTACQYGLMRVDDVGRVAEYVQYPLLEEWTNAGFMVFDRKVLEYFAEDNRLDLESGVLARLAREGQLMMYRHEGFWKSADTFREIQMLDDLWNAGEAPWKVW
jgi:glucose-1-phosphate cytidylyltransferase